MNATPAPVTNVLLIDDDAHLAGMVSDTLATRGYRVWHAATAADTQLVLDQARPDLIIVDLMLPDRNGLLLCAELKHRIGVPLIICSASRRKEDPALAFRLGADDFLAKPLSVDELEAALRWADSRAAAAIPANPAPQR